MRLLDCGKPMINLADLRIAFGICQGVVKPSAIDLALQIGTIAGAGIGLAQRVYSAAAG